MEPCKPNSNNLLADAKTKIKVEGKREEGGREGKKTLGWRNYF